MIDQGTLDCYLHGLMRLPEYDPPDDILIGAIRDMDLPELITARDRKFFQLGQLLTAYGAIHLLELILEKEAGND